MGYTLYKSVIINKSNGVYIEVSFIIFFTVYYIFYYVIFKL